MCIRPLQNLGEFDGHVPMIWGVKGTFYVSLGGPAGMASTMVDYCRDNQGCNLKVSVLGFRVYRVQGSNCIPLTLEDSSDHWNPEF